MSHQNYQKVTGFIFLLIALVHLWRIFNHLPVAYGTHFIPMGWSWVGVVVGGYLASQGLKKR